MIVETELSSGPRMDPVVGLGKFLPDFGGLDHFFYFALIISWFLEYLIRIY